MPDELRLSESDVTAILRRAAEDGPATGLTAADVREIALSVGLAPDAVQRAIADAASGMLREPSVRRQGGVPVAIQKEVTLPGPLTDEAWAVLVSTLRSTFSARGGEPKSTAVREWRNGNLRVTVEPRASGFRLRLSTAKNGTWPASLVTGGSMLLFSVFAAAGLATRQGPPMLWLLAGVPALLGAGMLSLPFWTLPAWARLRSAQFDAVAREAIALAAPTDDPQLPRG
jgi:hypothetical protein